EAYQKIADLDPSNTSVRMKLAEIYSRERMPDQAHEAFIMAGAEFLRKGDIEQALNANLKAIGINADRRQALSAIATIYTEQGNIERAINILCEAFERNPGDVELLTILGRTYLSAGLMDDAERTFLSLVELDKNRYHYLLEVGRRFLQLGDLDRASEQIDGCMEVLIAKREEDKAIDFLRRVLDRDMNHIGALKRLSQIFNRIREDHNLIATLNSLVEAAMKKGNETEAIAALKELARLEPDEPMHLQRLYNLGVRDIVEAGSPDVVRATGPLDYQSAAFDDTFVIRQISEAEILAGHGQVEHAVSMLKEILNHAPENVQVHQKLKDILLRAGLMDEAAAECVEIARIHESRGESARASDFLAEAKQINPLLETGSTAAPVDDGFAWGIGESAGYAQEKYSASGRAGSRSDAGFNLSQQPQSDWKSYETGKLDEASENAFTNFSHQELPPAAPPEVARPKVNDSRSFGFSFADIVSDDDELEAPSAPPAPPIPSEHFFHESASLNPEVAFNSSFSADAALHSDVMPEALRDELEGVDFYIAQGYLDVARDSLDRLRADHGDHPEVISRYRQLDEYETATETTGAPFFDEHKQVATETPASPTSFEQHDESDFFTDMPGIDDASSFASDAFDEHLAQGNGNATASDSGEFVSSEAGEFGFEITAMESSSNKEESGSLKPFIIQKESGPLYPDLLVKFNTSELSDMSALDAMRQFSGPLTVPAPPVPTGDLMPDMMSDFEAAIDDHSASPLVDIDVEEFGEMNSASLK